MQMRLAGINHPCRERTSFCASWPRSTGHFVADDCSPADADRWRQLKRHIVRFKDALDLARIELDRSSPDAATALKHVQ
jgi:hypothetical protein